MRARTMYRGVTIGLFLFVIGLAPLAWATDGTWINTTSGGLWSATGNWAGGVVASGSGATADFSTLDITGVVTVHLDSSRTIGTLKFGDTTPNDLIFVTNNLSGTIGEYTTSGATVNPALISGLNNPTGIAASGGNLFVGDFHNYRIGKYTMSGDTVAGSLVPDFLDGPAGVAISGGNVFVVINQPTGGASIAEYTTAGAPVNPSLITGLNSPINIAESGGYLFVTDGNGTIGKYNAVTGAPVNAIPLVSGLSSPYGIVVSGGNLFVANNGNGTIGEYNADTGAPVNPALVTGLSNPEGLALWGGNLYVTSAGNGTIGKYNAVTGAPVNPVPLVSGLSSPWGITTSSNGWILDDNGTAGANKLTLAGSPTITVNNQTAWITAVLAGTAGFTKNGAGTLTLSGGAANTITGGVDVEDGAIILNKPAGMKAISPTLTIGDGIGAPASATMTSLSVDQFPSGGANITILPDGRLDFGPNASDSINSLSFTGGALTGAANSFLALSGNITTNASSNNATISIPEIRLTTTGTTFNVAPGSTSNGIDLDVASTLADSGVSAAITKSGAGVMQISGNNTFTGRIHLNAGKLVIGSTSALNTSAPAYIEFGAGTTGTLVLNGFSVAVSQLGYSSADLGNPVIENASATPATLTYADDGTAHVFAGVLRDGAGGGALGFRKAGDGQLTLTRPNSFTGPLIINEGEFVQAGSLVCDVFNFSQYTHNNGTSFGGRLINSGVTRFEFSSAAGEKPKFTAGNGMQNNVNLSIDDGLTITLNGLGLDNEGTMTMAGGTLNLSTSPIADNKNRGNFTLFPSTPLNLGGGTFTNYGTFNLNTGSVSGPIGSQFVNGAGGTISAVGTIVTAFSNSGTVAIGNGTINVTQAFNNAGLIQLTAFNSSLTGGAIISTGEIDGFGSVANDITNTGTIEAIGGTLVLSGKVTNVSSGRIIAVPPAKVLFTGQVMNMSGNINFTGGTVEFGQPMTNGSNGAISGHGTLIVGGTTGLTNNGSVAIGGGATDVFGKVNNQTGVSTKGVTISGNSAAIFWDDVTNGAGSLFKVSAGSSATFFGTYAGAGITGPGTVFFESDITPGFSPASVTFGGDVALSSAAKLEIEVGGTIPGAQFDQVQVAGQLSLDGTLNVSLINGFAPAAGNSFDILDWGSLSGTFNTVAFPSLNADLMWYTSELYQTGTLRVVVAGDYDGNGAVNAADYVVWRKSLGTRYTQTDYDRWRSHFGQTAGSGAASNAAVPEPGPWALVGIGLSVGALGRRRRGGA